MAAVEGDGTEDALLAETPYLLEGEAAALSPKTLQRGAGSVGMRVALLAVGFASVGAVGVLMVKGRKSTASTVHGASSVGLQVKADDKAAAHEKAAADSSEDETTAKATTAKPTPQPTSAPTPAPMPAPTPPPTVGPWQCYHYEDDQDDDWCKTAGNTSVPDTEIRFVADAGTCGECWCCKRSIPPPKKCAKSGENCRKTECCEQEGFQCFEQDSSWATCKSTCTEEDWSCKAIGERSPDPSMSEEGAGPGQICAIAGKCKQEGYQCYQMNDYYSACKVTCDAKDWSCKEFGDRTPVTDRMGGSACAWGADLCSVPGCCVAEGMQCYSRDEYWSSCMRSCNHTMNFGGDDETWSCKTHGERTKVELGCTWMNEECTVTKKCCSPGFNCILKDKSTGLAYCSKEPNGEEGWDGTVVGGSNYEWEVPAVKPGDGKNESGTSLFCFMAVLPGSPEEALKEMAESKGASIFACDTHAVFNSWQSARGDTGDQNVDESWGSVINTDVFVNVWEQVIGDGRYKKHDWTVKVDPDAVFFADRLKYKLERLHAPKGWPIYIKNTVKDFGFLGACEVLSMAAVEKYSRYFHQCFAAISARSGEDGFIKGCMDMIGAGYMTELDVLRTPFHDGACSDPGRVTFHPRKQPGEWEQCFNEATGGWR